MQRSSTLPMSASICGMTVAKRVSVIRVAGQRCGMGDELAAGGMLHGGGDAHLDAELVGPVRLALADALDLRRVQGIDLAAALAALLFQHAPGQEQRSHERLPQNLIPDDVPLDVADDAAKIGLELAQALVGALELMGVGVTLVLDH